MRALILVLCAVVVILTIPVLLHAGGAVRTTQVGERFYPGILLYDAKVGEEATYRASHPRVRPSGCASSGACSTARAGR